MLNYELKFLLSQNKYGHNFYKVTQILYGAVKWHHVPGEICNTAPLNGFVEVNHYNIQMDDELQHHFRLQS